jgi:hypothetical protein
MGITPITSLIPIMVSRAVPADLEPMPMERVENSSRAGDETYSPSGEKSARGSEDDAAEDAEDEQDDLDCDDSGTQFTLNLEALPRRPISFFA